MRAFLFAAVWFSPLLSSSQNLPAWVINVGGKSMETSNSAITFSIGEPVVGSKEVGQNTLSQGFIQGRLGTITGLESREIESFTPYPNPTTDRFFIDSSCDCTVDVNEVTGKIMIAKVRFANGVEVSHLSPGLYMVNMFDANGRKIGSQKLFKK